MVSLPVCAPALPPLPDLAACRRLSALRARLLELAACCPPGCACALAAAAECLEDGLAALGWAEPLTEHDEAVLDGLGAL